MILPLLCNLWLLVTYQEIPLRSAESFDVSANFEMRTEKQPRNDNYFHEKPIPYDPRPKMHLDVKVVLKEALPNESYWKLTNDTDELFYKKKVKKGKYMLIEYGDLEKVKLRESTHLYYLTFYSKKHEALSQIILDVKDNGALFINNQPHK